MSNYMDFWFFDKRNRMKNLIFYFILFVAFFIFSNIMIYMFVKGSYNEIESKNIKLSNPDIAITVTEAKATSTNGYIKGTVKNNSDKEIKEQNIKFYLFTERDVNAGNETFEISNIKPEEEKEFEIKFKQDNVKYFKITN